MRAVNEFGLIGEWSEAVSLNLTMVETISSPTTRPTTENRPGITERRGLPIYGRALIGLVVILAVMGGIVAALAVMCLIVNYRRKQTLMESVSYFLKFHKTSQHSKKLSGNISSHQQRVKKQHKNETKHNQKQHKL